MRRFFSQMMIRPAAAVASGMEMLGQRVEGMPRIDGIVSRIVHTLSRPSSNQDRRRSDTTPQADNAAGEEQSRVTVGESNPPGETMTLSTESAHYNAQVKQMNGRNAHDKCLSDDMLKLVRYKILFVKRDYEVAFPEREELVYDNMTDTAYTAWKIAQFIQELDQTEVPAQWGGGRNEDRVPKYPPPVRDRDGRLLTPRWGARRGAWVIRSLPEDDKKYLRVYFQVLDRYVREDLQYEQQQLDALEDIAKAIREKDRHRGGVVSTERADEGTYTEGAD